MQYYLGIDGGGTHSAWRLLDEEGGCVASGELGPICGLLQNPRLRRITHHSLKDLNAALAGYKIGGVFAAITGLSDGDRNSRILQKYLSRLWQCPMADMRITSDMEAAYYAAFDDREGILVYAGTGSVATRRDETGEWHRAGGRGNLIGDEGGGYWIAQQAVKHIWKERDLRGKLEGASTLENALYAALDSSEWNDWRSFIYGGDRGTMAKLAPVVGKAAEAGDLAAQKILFQAGEELAWLGKALLSRAQNPHLPIALLGGALKISPLIRQAFGAAVGQDVTVIQVQDFDPARAAAQQAFKAGKRFRNAP